MGLTNVKLLDVSNNMLLMIEFGAFIGLNIEHLDLSTNQLEEIPYVEPLANHLRALDLSKNRIKTIEPFIFTNFTAIKELILSGNAIVILLDYALHTPGTKLDAVNIDRNGLTMIGQLAFSKINADVLHLNENSLTEFPCLRNIRSVQRLYLDGNAISVVPEECGQWWGGIEGLFARPTALTSIDNITKHTPHLRELHMHNPGIMIVSDETFKKTTRLYSVVMPKVSQFPLFYDSKSTIGAVFLSGGGINCIDKAHLHGTGTEIRYQDPSALPWSKMATATTGKDVYTAIIPGQWWLDLV